MRITAIAQLLLCLVGEDVQHALNMFEATQTGCETVQYKRRSYTYTKQVNVHVVSRASPLPHGEEVGWLARLK